MSAPSAPKSQAKIHGRPRTPLAKKVTAERAGRLEMSGRALRIASDAVAASLASDKDRQSFA